MVRLSRRRFAAMLFIGCLVVAGASTHQAAAQSALVDLSEAEIGQIVAGTWSDTSGRNAKWFLKTEGDQITGRARIPNSSFDRNPTVKGSFKGQAVTFTQSSGWRFDLTLRRRDNGDYVMSGLAKRGHRQVDARMRKTK